MKRLLLIITGLLLWHGTAMAYIVDGSYVRSLPEMPEYSIEIVDEYMYEGSYNTGTRQIILRKQNRWRMDRVLRHELQHVIDDMYGIRGEWNPTVNEIIWYADRFWMGSGDIEVVEAYFNKKIGRFLSYGAYDKMRKVIYAKSLFMAFLGQ